MTNISIDPASPQSMNTEEGTESLNDTLKRRVKREVNLMRSNSGESKDVFGLDQNRQTFQTEATAQFTGLMQAGRSIITTVLCQQKTENST